MLESGKISGGVQRFDPNAFRGLPRQIIERFERHVLRLVAPLLKARLFRILREWHCREIRDLAHDRASSA